MMITREEIATFFKQNRLFEENEYLYDEVIPKLTDYQSFLVESENFRDFVPLMYALDDDTKMFEITQIFIESVPVFYYKFKQLFFNYFLENINVIYPHAVEMTANILFSILYDDNEARQYLCDSLDDVENEKLLIFKEIYLFMIEKDNMYISNCILKKLEL